ncbi:LacI family transcriptional regulator [Pseudomaricurvus alkylphenolicus]|jgi:LacI family transcriptional regulator|uniref:LacI family DNA-binding transcriptional regulator n=1 Tax=Pseudomaricurvus alkylphenolicus TaxID=1306991 RepID=UPI00142234D4|nr:LacI family DNA-binding transcriptional regulator [Pseudomaricurvus alkylphenolicus]NIB40115.1 LacI family transcriptional regulator [Pseudomaricurvus alkylphenolicus]
MKPTIKDVAKLAGVSFKTVSRVINNEPSVGEALKEKVWKAVKELNYQPNLSARHLRGGSSFIGFIYDNPNSHYVISMQHGILQECRRQGFELVIHPCDAKSDTITDELAEMVERGHLAGLVLTPPVSETREIIEDLGRRGIKFVRIISGSEEPDDLSPCVYIDDRNAAREITQYLIDLGHTRIGFLSGDTVHSSSGEREEGYRQALHENGLTVDESLVLQGQYSFESGVERTKQLLSLESPPSAVFACNDEIAAGTLFAARLLGTEVPGKLSIVGFEDNPFSRQTWPKLTTAAQPTSQIAASAAALLIQSTRTTRSGQNPTEAIENGFHPQLVVRDSTAEPA